MKKFFTLLLLTIFLASILTGCKKKHGDPPILPPSASMAIDFSNFESGKKSAAGVMPKGVNDYNWGFSALVAGYWRAITFVTLAVPVMSFEAAMDQTPAYIEDKTWQWSYTSTVFTVKYKVRLTGQIRSSDVLWKMYITREGTGGFAEFVWFEGTSDLDGKGGQWTLNHSSTYQEPVLTITWEGDGTKVTYIKYTYVRALNDSRVADPFKNSYIEYGLKTTLSYDSYYKIYYYNGSAFANMDVEWSSTNLNGRVKCNAFYSDDLWHCWNENYVDIICP
ncbi:MAG: hypothetical protein NT092_06530 [Bacteroidia bacterium]|nr:hypothetical protein [Bacteroidia bacterium]